MAGKCALCWIVLIGCVAGISPARADWLASQAQSDGSYSAAGDLATPTQATSEAVRALRLLGRSSEVAASDSFLASQNDTATEYLSRRIVSEYAAGNLDATLVPELMSYQNSDGGFGGQSGFASDPLDTAFALDALASSGNSGGAGVGPAVSYLLKQQAADGSWIDSGGDLDVYTTALAARAMSAYQGQYPAVSPALASAATFLLSRRNGGGSWGSDLLSAQAVLTLATIGADPASVQQSAAALSAAQRADGSWSEDVYSTALALRALLIAKGTASGPSASAGSLGGYVLSSGTGEPLADATVSVSGTSLSATSGSDGYFLIEGVPTGPVTVVASLSGYGSSSVVAAPQSGQLVKVGPMILSEGTNTAVVRGVVVDASSQVPLSGATITLSGPGSYSVVSSANGSFELDGIAAGTYTINLSANGYNSVSGSLSASAGSVTAIRQGLTVQGTYQDSSPGTIAGQIVDATTGQPVAGATLTLNGNTTATSASDGSFSFATVPRENCQIQVVANGYASRTYSFVFAPGDSGSLGTLPIFAATGSSAPTTLTLVGTVIDGVDNHPLTGASVTVTQTGQVYTADSNGEFTVSGLSSLNFSLTISAAGYQTRSFSGSASGFGQVSGSFELTPTSSSGTTTTTISGTVSDATSGKPIAGATLAISGSSVSATSGTDGSYLLANIQPLTLTLAVSAPGYQSRTYNVNVTQAGAYALNVQMTAVQNAGSNQFQVLSFNPLQSSSGANTVQQFAAQVANLQSTAQQASVLIDVQDATGATVATVSPYAPGTTVPAVQVSFGASATVDLVIPWNTQQFPPGTYRLVLRVVQPGTVSRDLPSGVVLAQADTHATVDPTSAILGQVAFNPPLTQAGSSTPVDLSALVINSGNVTLTGASFTLTLSDPSSGQALTTLHATAASIGVGQNALLDFGTWVPTISGNLPVTVSADDTTVQGRLSGTLYVGNEATGTFTVDKSVVPLGTQTVHATVAMQGVNATTATSTDPLFAAVKQAIQRGALFVGPQVRQWNQTNRCLGCHIQTQSFTGMAASMNKADVSPADVEYLYNDIAGSLQADGRILPAHTELPETQTALAIWALSGWHDAAQAFRTLYRGSLYQLSRMSTSGNESWWNNDYCGIWVCNVPSQVMTSVKGMVATLNMAKQLGTTTVNDYEFADTGQSFGMPNMMGAQEAADGSVWYLDNAGNLYRRDPTTGTSQVVANGLGSPTIGLVVAADGTAYVTNPSALIKIAPGGTKTTLLSGGSVQSLWDVEMGPDGNLYVSDNSAIWRVTPDGQATQFVSGGLINRLQGLAFDSNGNLYASNYGGWDILKITPDGTVSVFSEGLPFQPIWLRMGPDGYLYAMTQQYSSFGTVPPGIFRINASGYLERLPLFSAPNVYGYDAMAVINGKICVNNSSNLHLYCLNIVPQDTSQLPAMLNAVTGAARYTIATCGGNSPWNDIEAMCLITLGEARTQISDTTLLSQIDGTMASIASLLRSRQAADGGWPYTTGRTASDPYATAFVGLALQYTDPSPSDPALRKAITFLLNSQQPDGSWSPATGAFTTKLGPASFVMAFLPKALDLLGGIDTGLNITFPASVQLSNPSLPPTTQSTAGDGSTTYNWSLLGVTSQGRTVDFDLTLANMGYNENRAVASSAYLSFANSFTGEQLKLDLAIPHVRAVSSLALSVGVDQSAYPANTPVNISSTINNVGPPVASGQVHLFIRTSDGTLVADLGSTGFGALATGASTVVPNSWNTGTLLAGGYEVDAQLYDATGQLVDEGVGPFSIVAPNAVLSAAIAADKTSYQASDSVILTAKIINASANVAVAPSTATLSVQTPSGAALYSINFPINSLMPGAIVEVPEVVPLQDAANGAYPVQLAIYDSVTHALLATATGTFQVQENLTLALKGSVSAQSGSLYVGQSQICTDSVTNNGSQAVSGLALQQLLVRLDQTATVSTTPQSVDLAPGVSQQLLQGFSTAGLMPGDYACILQAQVNGVSQTLGYAAFKLTPPPIIIKAQLALGTKGRVLALLDATPKPSCGRAHDIELWAAFHTRLPDDARVEVDLLDANGNRVDSETVVPASFRGDVHRSPGHGADLIIEGISPDVITIDVRGEPELIPGYQVKVTATAASLPPMTLETGAMGSECGWPMGEGEHFGDFESSHVSPSFGAAPPSRTEPEPAPDQRRTFLESLLQQAGWSYTIVTDEESFEQDMLSGAYSEYALFAERLKLDDQIQKAVREAVNRGEGLLDADEHDEDEEAGLSDALGIRFVGRQSQATSVEFLGTGLPEAGTTPLAFPWDALRARAEGAQVTALFPDLVGDGDAADAYGHRQRGFYAREGADPHGEDRGSLDTAVTTYGYGLGQSVYAGYDLLAEATQAGSSSLQAFALRDALGHVMSPLSALHAGEVIPLHLSLQNQGIATSGQVQMTLPAGVTVVDPGSGTVNNGVLTFAYSLAVGQTLDFYAWVRLPDQSGATEFDALIQTSQNGVFSDYGHATYTASTDAYATVTDAISLAGASREFRDSQFWLEAAQWRLSRNQPQYALVSLLQATDELVDNQSPQAVLLRLDIDQAIWTLSRQVAGDDLH